MQTTIIAAEKTPSKAALWTGRILMGLLTLFLLFDAVTKIFPPKYVIDASAKVGWGEETLRPLGLVLLISTVLYVIPRTTILGAILLTAYLGGATASNILAGYNFAFPIIFGILVWCGLMLTHSGHRKAFLNLTGK
ncbi:MAG TPA: DoxX family protein [Puia sp.]|nr:DoxX family protein [Puia sp.]